MGGHIFFKFYLFIYLFVCLFVCLFIFIYLFIYFLFIFFFFGGGLLLAFYGINYNVGMLQNKARLTGASLLQSQRKFN